MDVFRLSVWFCCLNTVMTVAIRNRIIRRSGHVRRAIEEDVVDLPAIAQPEPTVPTPVTFGVDRKTDVETAHQQQAKVVPSTEADRIQDVRKWLNSGESFEYADKVLGLGDSCAGDERRTITMVIVTVSTVLALAIAVSLMAILMLRRAQQHRRYIKKISNDKVINKLLLDPMDEDIDDLMATAHAPEFAFFPELSAMVEEVDVDGRHRRANGRSSRDIDLVELDGLFLETRPAKSTDGNAKTMSGGGDCSDSGNSTKASSVRETDARDNAEKVASGHATATTAGARLGGVRRPFHGEEDEEDDESEIDEPIDEEKIVNRGYCLINAEANCA